MSIQQDIQVVDGLSNSGGEGRPVSRVLVFTIVAFALAMTSVDATIVATALHALQRGLHASINWAGWTITAYSFGFVLMLPVSGKFSERYGCRKVFLWSIVAFTVASLGCGLADNIYVLIALRALQAAGGAGFTPSATGIIVERFGDERDRAVGFFGSIFSTGAMVGPIFGGIFVTYWSWRDIFFVNVPIGIVVVALAMRYIPRDQPKVRGSMAETDIFGMSLLGVGLLTGMLAASYMGEKSAHLWSWMFLAPMVVAIVSLWGFFRHVNRSAHPFIAPRLIYGTGFGAVNLVNGIIGGVTEGAVVLVPLYAINRYGFSALDSGTLLLAEGAAAIVFSFVAAVILRRTGYRMPLYLGGLSIIAGLILLALPPSFGIGPYAWLAGSAFLVGAGNGAINPASRNGGLQLAPEHSSTLAALRSMAMQIGAITVVTIATAILATAKNHGLVQAWIFIAAAALLIVSLPLIARVPEHRGSW
ncbi:MAG: MFS transporter [Acidobacteriaceae bacterium]